MSDSYTCITCRVAFKTSEIQRLHYKTDWHRYNLKRKVAELIPVTAEEFINRVNAHKNELLVEEKTKFCESCRKNFNNEKSYNNHLNSKKHQVNELQNIGKPERTSRTASETTVEVKSNQSNKEKHESESSYEEVDSDDWEDDDDDADENPTVNHVCIFCTHRSRSLIRNLRHMSLKHSFFIPDAEYCTNVEGLIRYLGEKVYNGWICLWCNETGRSFHSAEAAQGHMRDKGHCKMLHEGAVLVEYVDFYDYSASYPQAEQDQVLDIDEEIEDPTSLDTNDFQLVLPSGAVIGHRSLFRYYKQRLGPDTTAVATKTGQTLRKVLSEYKSLGWLETKRELANKKARDMNYMVRVQNKWAVKLQLKANKFQPHFRQQVNF